MVLHLASRPWQSYSGSQIPGHSLKIQILLNIAPFIQILGFVSKYQGIFNSHQTYELHQYFL